MVTVALFTSATEAPSIAVCVLLARDNTEQLSRDTGLITVILIAVVVVLAAARAALPAFVPMPRPILVLFRAIAVLLVLAVLLCVGLLAEPHAREPVPSPSATPTLPGQATEVSSVKGGDHR